MIADSQIQNSFNEIVKDVKKIKKCGYFSDAAIKSGKMPQIKQSIIIQTVTLLPEDLQQKVLNKKIPIKPMVLRQKILTKKLTQDPNDSQQKVDILEYKQIYVQSIKQCQQIQKKVNIQNANIKSTIEKNSSNIFSKIFQSSQQKKKSQKIVKQSQVIKKQIDSRFKLFLAPWNDTSLHYRVACIHGQQKKNIQSHFWVYTKTEEEAKTIKDRLHFIYMNQKYGTLVNRMKNNYHQNVKKRLVQALLTQVDKKDPNNKDQSKIIQPIQPQSPKIYIPFNKFDQYQQQSLSQLIKVWRKRAVQQQKMSRKKLFIEIKAIKLDKNLVPDQVYLTVDKFQRQKYKYVGSNQNHLIFTPLKKQVYVFQSEQFYHRNLKFQVSASKGRSIKTYAHSLTFQKIDQHVLGFAYQLGLTSSDKRDIPQNFSGSFPYLLSLEAVARNINFKMSNVLQYRKIRLLQELGKIPNSYSSHLSFPYNPNTFNIVQAIVSKKNYPLTKQTFQKTYLDLANYTQLQENKSKNFAIYVTQFKKNLDQNEECYKIIHRMSVYSDKLKSNQQKLKYQNQLNNKLRQRKVMVNHVNLSNFNDDFLRYESDYKFLIQKLMKRYLILIDIYNQKEVSNFKDEKQMNKSQLSPLKYLTPLIKIAERLINVSTYSDKYSIRESMQIKADDGVNQILWLYFSFIKNLYPYSSIQNLKIQLYHIRALAQKYLPQFNQTLNRKGIGLQNFVAKHLLTFFTQLNTELTFRIWDLLINFQDKFKGRIIIIYTLMIYYQVTDLLPIIPINQFVSSVRQNYSKIVLDSGSVYHFNKSMNTFSKNRVQKQQKIVHLAQQKYLKRFILSKGSSSLPMQNQNIVLNLNNGSEVQRKLFSLQQLRYPLPQPKYMGYPVQKVQILVHYLSIIQNINVIKYRHKMVITFARQTKTFILDAKTLYTNWYVQIPFSNSNRDETIYIDIFGNTKPISQENGESQFARQKHVLAGSIDVENFHKDKAYKINICLEPIQEKVRQLHKSLANIQTEPFKTKGQSVVSLSLCLHSKNKKQKIRQRQVEEEIVLNDRLLDYDLNTQSNSGMKIMQKFLQTVEKMKRPLDQFGKQQYTNLKIAAADISIPEWILNSKVTVQELKAIFYAVFYERQQQDQRLQFSQIYQQFTEKQGFQQFDFGLMLLKLILLTDLSRQKKLTLLYCLSVHYQNCLSKKITLETINSIIKQIHYEHGFLNAIPMITSSNQMGSIEGGWFYSRGTKSTDNKRDITLILKDWVTICKIRYGYSGIILGSNEDLAILRSLFATVTLQQIMKERYCRFEIIYSYNRRKYQWSVIINTNDFSINERGNKFLNSYPKYQEISYLDSTGEILLNCENFIPLQSNINKTYEEFSNIIKNQELLNYLITHSISNHNQAKIKKSQLSMKQNVSPSYVRIPQKQTFKDYGIYRHQNCIDQWKICRIVKQQQGEPNCIVQFQDFPSSNNFYLQFLEYYSLPKFQLMNMGQNLQWEQNSQVQSQINF